RVGASRDGHDRAVRSFADRRPDRGAGAVALRGDQDRAGPSARGHGNVLPGRRRGHHTAAEGQAGAAAFAPAWKWLRAPRRVVTSDIIRRTVRTDTPKRLATVRSVQPADSSVSSSFSRSVSPRSDGMPVEPHGTALAHTRSNSSTVVVMTLGNWNSAS